MFTLDSIERNRPMYVGKDWNKGLRQAQANANASNVPWIVWMYLTDVHCERATERDMASESGKMRDGGVIVEPTEDRPKDWTK
jgi:hypothetical protein